MTTTIDSALRQLAQVKRSGRFLRIAATWRGGKNPNVAVHAETGAWRDHATGDSGTWQELCQRLGISPEPQSGTVGRPATPKNDFSRRTWQANRVWDAAIPLSPDNTTADYLAQRGGQALLERAMECGVRVAKLSQGEGYLPADCLVWPRRTGVGHLIGVQREWPNGAIRKKMLGPSRYTASQGKLPVAPYTAIPGTGRTLLIAEGALTALAVAVATGWPAIAAHDAGCLETLDLAEIIRNAEHFDDVIIAADSDYEDKRGVRRGIEAANRLAGRLASDLPQKTIFVSLPTREGSDWLDILNECGADETRATLLSARQIFRAPPPHLSSPSGLSRLNWFRLGGVARQQTPPLSIEDGERLVSEALSQWSAGDEATILCATTGLGKTRAVARMAATSEKPLFILTPTSSDVADLTSLIADLGGDVVRHVGRSPENCLIFHERVEPLRVASRSPAAWACTTCPHGSADSATPCGYMAKLRDSLHHRVVVAAHAAGADESALFTAYGDFEGQTIVDRRVIVDESIPTNTRHKIGSEDVQLWRRVLKSSEDTLRFAASAASQEIAAGASGKALTVAKAKIRALAWADAAMAVLAALQISLAAAPADSDLHAVDCKTEPWATFARVCKSVPALARVGDGTIAESVIWPSRPGENPVVPVRAITSLARAIERGTVWTQSGEIIAATPASLFSRVVVTGGLMLDATPSQVAQASARVVRIDVEQRGGVVQIGPLAHGRGYLADPATREREAAGLIARMAEGTVSITHKPLAAAVTSKIPGSEDKIGHWGRDEKSHNRWKAAEKLILWGVDVPHPTEQVIGYAIARASMLERGIAWPEWRGDVATGQEVETGDGYVITYPGPLPIVEEARDWLIDHVTQKVVQADGRLRRCRRSDDPETIICSPFPLRGHGLKITRREIGGSGRQVQRGIQEAMVAQAVATLGHDATLTEIRNFARSAGVNIGEHRARWCRDQLLHAAQRLHEQPDDYAAKAVAEAKTILESSGGKLADALAQAEAIASIAVPVLTSLWWAETETILQSSTAKSCREARAGP